MLDCGFIIIERVLILVESSIEYFQSIFSVPNYQSKISVLAPGYTILLQLLTNNTVVQSQSMV